MMIWLCLNAGDSLEILVARNSGKSLVVPPVLRAGIFFEGFLSASQLEPFQLKSLAACIRCRGLRLLHPHPAQLQHHPGLRQKRITGSSCDTAWSCAALKSLKLQLRDLTASDAMIKQLASLLSVGFRSACHVRVPLCTYNFFLPFQFKGTQAEAQNWNLHGKSNLSVFLAQTSCKLFFEFAVLPGAVMVHIGWVRGWGFSRHLAQVGGHTTPQTPWCRTSCRQGASTEFTWRAPREVAHASWDWRGRWHDVASALKAIGRGTTTIAATAKAVGPAYTPTLGAKVGPKTLQLSQGFCHPFGIDWVMRPLPFPKIADDC